MNRMGKKRRKTNQKNNKKEKKKKSKSPSKSWIAGKYRIALSKWLKVIFWYIEDLKAEDKKLDERMKKLEKSIRLIKEKLDIKEEGDSRG